MGRNLRELFRKQLTENCNLRLLESRNIFIGVKGNDIYPNINQHFFSPEVLLVLYECLANYNDFTVYLESAEILDKHKTSVT